MTRRILEVLSLTLVWAALWSDFDLATVLSGVLVSSFVLALVPPSTFGAVGRVRPVKLARFIAATLWTLIKSNVTVAIEALTPGSKIQEAVVAVPVAGADEELMTIVATSISLAPGTVAVDFRGETVYVHVLHASDLERVRSRLDRQIEAVREFLGREPLG